MKSEVCMKFPELTSR